MQRIKAKWIIICFQDFHYLFVETLLVHSENTGGIDRQRTVHINLDLWQKTGIVEIIQAENNILCTTDGEGGNDQFALLDNTGIFHHLQQIFLCVGDLFVQPVTVG